MIRSDHVLHFLANVIATSISVILYQLSPVFLIPALALGLSIGKEYGDSKAPGNTWDWSDIAADVLGILTVLIIMFINSIE